ncbi:hypothetical protein Misp02_23650 [Microtetraspora sp. NBRC 16547]|nr:hypothetical protein Misp02_23650 [Microtetraspora sp. NBRC 16547]
MADKQSNRRRSTAPSRGWVTVLGRSLSVGAASLGGPVVGWSTHPVMGLAVALFELMAVASVVWAALFGSETVHERAFRLLRWVGNRPEPRGPRSHPPHHDVEAKQPADQ